MEAEGFKYEIDVLGDTIKVYQLFGTGCTIMHDISNETVNVYDRTFTNDERNVKYTEGEFFESYAGYHLGTDDTTIDDVVRNEYKFMIDMNCDQKISKVELKQFNNKVDHSFLVGLNNINKN